MIRRIIFMVIIAAVFFSLPLGAKAQAYSFYLETEVVHVYWNADGTMSLDYTLVFNNSPSGHAIEFIDLGLPNSSFDETSIQAEIDGQPVAIISTSDYQGSGSGVAIGLGKNAIAAGQTGAVHIWVGTVENVLRWDDQDETYASAVFVPNYFGALYVLGKTDLTVIYHLPQGVQMDEPRWHKAPADFTEEPVTGLDQNDQITYTWHNPEAFGQRKYTFGASFPAIYVPATTIYVPTTTKDNPTPKLNSKQQNRFNLETEFVNVYWNTDGTMSLNYNLKFKNGPASEAIKFIDLRLPNSSFEETDIQVEIDGQAVTSISKSVIIPSRVTIDLGQNTISAGETGIVDIRVAIIRDVIKYNDNNLTYASAAFIPNYFSTQAVQGRTDLTVTFYLPPGVQPDELSWQKAPFGFNEKPEIDYEQDRIMGTWRNPEAQPFRGYRFEVFFPAKYVPAETILGLNVANKREPEKEYFGCGLTLGLIILGIVGNFLWRRNERKRKMSYLPPQISIEGYGIKRSLTAVEAAILLEVPLDKIVTMVLYSVVKKGAATIISQDPLKLEISTEIPENLRAYEKSFLEAFQLTEVSKRNSNLQKMIVALIKSVGQLMRGFSHNDTKSYYRTIIEKAWQDVESEDTPAIQCKNLEKQLDWVMLDKDFDQHTKKVFKANSTYDPAGSGQYDPDTVKVEDSSTIKPFLKILNSKPAPTQPISGAKPSTSSPSRPDLPGGALAAEIVTNLQNSISKILGNPDDFSKAIRKKTMPKITREYNSRHPSTYWQEPKITRNIASEYNLRHPSTYRQDRHPSGRSSASDQDHSSSDRSSSRSSCACACACAGCACACAGGGR